MNAARLAEILTEPSPRGLDEILDDPSAAAIPGLKALVPMTVVDRPLVLAALGACVMAEHEEHEKVWAKVEATPSGEIAVDRPSFLPPNYIAPTASSLHRDAKGDERLLEDIDKAELCKCEDLTTIRGEVIHQLVEALGRDSVVALLSECASFRILSEAAEKHLLSVLSES